MIRQGVLGVVAGAVLMLGSGAVALADNLSSVFSVRLYGAPVGRMILAANAGGGSYAAKGEFRTTGLVGLLAKVRFTMSAHGVGAPLTMASRSYSEDLDTGYRTSATSLTFGTGDARIDPLTALLAALIDRPADTGCAFEGQTFDGTRSMSIRIREGAKTEDGLTCSGTLRRLSGYTAEEMAEATTFPFTVQFWQSGDQLMVRRGDVATIHGKVTLVRQ